MNYFVYACGLTHSCTPSPALLCSAACAQADWARHRGPCQALRLLRAGAAEVRPAAGLWPAAVPQLLPQVASSR